MKCVAVRFALLATKAALLGHAVARAHRHASAPGLRIDEPALTAW